MGVIYDACTSTRQYQSTHHQTVVLSVSDVGVLWINGQMDQDETRHGGSPRPLQHCVRWGPSSPTKKAPKFSAHDRCGQTAGWINVACCPGTLYCGCPARAPESATVVSVVKQGVVSVGRAGTVRPSSIEDYRWCMC